jgi:hypothetical protein
MHARAHTHTHSKSTVNTENKHSQETAFTCVIIIEFNLS